MSDEFDEENFDDDFTPWTAEGEAAVREQGRLLALAVLAHTEVIANAKGDNDAMSIFESADRLAAACETFTDAQFDYTGTGAPLGSISFFDDDVDDEDDEDVEEIPATGFSVLSRHDFGVADASAVMTAGRKAYRNTWPEDSEEDASADVSHLGRAIYQMLHHGGLEVLTDTEGLVPKAGATLVVANDDLLVGATLEDEFPDDLFDVEGELLHSQTHIWS